MLIFYYLLKLIDNDNDKNNHLKSCEGWNNDAPNSAYYWKVDNIFLYCYWRALLNLS